MAEDAARILEGIFKCLKRYDPQTLSLDHITFAYAYSGEDHHFPIRSYVIGHISLNSAYSPSILYRLALTRPFTNCYTKKRGLEKRDRFLYDLLGMLVKPIRLQ